MLGEHNNLWKCFLYRICNTCSENRFVVRFSSLYRICNRANLSEVSCPH